MEVSVEDEVPLLVKSGVEGILDYKGHEVIDRSKFGRWKSISFIIGAEIAGTFAQYCIFSNLITYLTGSQCQSTVTAAENVYIGSGIAYVLPVLGAFLADSYLGRFRTILFSFVIYVLGLGLLTLSSVMPSLNLADIKSSVKNNSCPSSLQVFLFISSLYLISMAQGGIKPCMQAFGADQFDGQDPEERELKSYFFNWWFFGLGVGNSVSILIVNYIQENLDWGLSFGISCIYVVFGMLIFVYGRKTYRYRYIDYKKSAFVKLGEVLHGAARNWRLKSPSFVHIQEGNENITRISAYQFKFLDGALVSEQNDPNICNKIRQVEDAKAVLRLVPIWATSLIYGVVYVQSSTFFTKQGNTMDRSFIRPNFKISAASFQAFILIVIVLFVPIYSRVFVPFTRYFTGKPSGITMLQRIGCGRILSVTSMLIAAIVEKRRLQIAINCGLVDSPEATIPMTIWWLAPQYIVLGLADVFTTIGLQEFFYDQVPDGFRSIGLSLVITVFGMGNFLSDILVSIIEKITCVSGQSSWFSNNLNRAHLDLFYWLLAGLSVLEFIGYLYFSTSYLYDSKAQVMGT